MKHTFLLAVAACLIQVPNAFAAALVVSPSELAFAVTAGEPAPAPQTIRVTTATGERVAFKVATMGIHWLTSNDTTVYTPGNYTIGYNGYVPAAGTEKASIVVYTVDLQSRIELPVTLIYRQTTSVLTVSRTEVTLTVLTGEWSPEQRIIVTSSGIPLPFAVSNGATWLAFEPSLVFDQAIYATPATLAFRANAKGLTAGRYEASIGITCLSLPTRNEICGPGNGNNPNVQHVGITVVLNVLNDLRPKITGITSSNTSLPIVSPGSWVSIYGSNLAGRTHSVSTLEIADGLLPNSIDGTVVRIGGHLSPIHYVSPTQLNVLVPTELTGFSGAMPVEVTAPEGLATGTVELRDVTPGPFTIQSGGKQLAAAVFVDGSNIVTRPARPGEVLMVFGSGFGPTSPFQKNGFVAPPPSTVTLPVDVRVGGLLVKVLYGGLVGPGLYQFNIEVPNVTAGDQPVVFQVNGISSPNGVVIPVSP